MWFTQALDVMVAYLLQNRKQGDIQHDGKHILEGVEFVPGVVPGLAVLPAPGELLEMKMLGSRIRNPRGGTWRSSFSSPPGASDASSSLFRGVEADEAGCGLEASLCGVELGQGVHALLITLWWLPFTVRIKLSFSLWPTRQYDLLCPPLHLPSFRPSRHSLHSRRWAPAPAGSGGIGGMSHLGRVLLASSPSDAQLTMTPRTAPYSKEPSGSRCQEHWAQETQL